jgi:hypothetical protein
MDQPAHPGFCRRVRQDSGGLRLVMIRCLPPRTVRAVGEMHNDFDTVEVPRPIGRGTDISDRAKLDAPDWFRRTPG